MNIACVVQLSVGQVHRQLLECICWTAMTSLLFTESRREIESEGKASWGAVVGAVASVTHIGTDTATRLLTNMTVGQAQA